MTVPVCAREAEALEVVLHGGWPSCADAELRAHVDQCPVCADVVAVAVAMQEEHTLACQQAHVPTAGLVWWRAELRARQEAARKATRPMTFVQGIAAACGLAALLTMAGLFSPWVRAHLAGLIDVPARLPSFDVAAVTGLLTYGGLALLLAVGAWLVLVPVALYVVFSRD
jgi:hypothetical protein